jgi:putative SOS response-associated peptidase YedK
MCSRFWGAPDGQEVLTAMEEYGPVMPTTVSLGLRKQNTAPTEPMLSVMPGKEGWILSEIESWGFTLPDSKQLLINGKIETVLDRSLFAGSVRERRCLIPAEGFIEWDGEKGHKQPILFGIKDKPLLWFAGIWREFHSKTQGVVLTTEPNELVAKVHNRMPVLVREEHMNLWLSGETNEAVGTCIEPFPAELMTTQKLDKAVSNARYSGDLQSSLF